MQKVKVNWEDISVNKPNLNQLFQNSHPIGQDKSFYIQKEGKKTKLQWSAALPSVSNGNSPHGNNQQDIFQQLAEQTLQQQQRRNLSISNNSNYVQRVSTSPVGERFITRDSNIFRTNYSPSQLDHNLQTFDTPRAKTSSSRKRPISGNMNITASSSNSKQSHAYVQINYSSGRRTPYVTLQKLDTPLINHINLSVDQKNHKQKSQFMSIQYIGVHDDVIGILTRQEKMSLPFEQSIAYKNYINLRRKTQTNQNQQIQDYSNQYRISTQETQYHQSRPNLQKIKSIYMQFLQANSESRYNNEKDQFLEQFKSQLNIDEYQELIQLITLTNKPTSPEIIPTQEAEIATINLNQLEAAIDTQLTETINNNFNNNYNTKDVPSNNHESSVQNFSNARLITENAYLNMYNIDSRPTSTVSVQQRPKTVSYHTNEQTIQKNFEDNQSALDTSNFNKKQPNPEAYNQFLVNKYSISRRLNTLRLPKQQREDDSEEKIKVDWKSQKVNYVF